MNYQPLYELLDQEHGVTLLENEAQEIINCVLKMQNVYTEDEVLAMLNQLKSHSASIAHFNGLNNVLQIDANNYLTK